MAPTHPRLERSKIVTTLQPWDKNENVIWLASTMALHRNIEKFKFPHKLELEKKRHIVELISKALNSFEKLESPFLLYADELSPIEKNFLLEHFLVFEGFQEATHGEAFTVDESGQFLALINVKDHLRLSVTDTEGDLEKSWGKLVSYENSLTTAFNFAFSQKFGFLTADPKLSGTGLVIEAFIHLPALIHLGELQDFLEKEKNDACLVSGLLGNPDELIGDIVTIRNAFTLGVNEETIISTLRSAILKFVLFEKNARGRIQGEKITHFMDLVSRAVGTLKSSYELETVEALNALSLVKLGVELGWVKMLSVQQCNKLLFGVRRSHLNYHLKENIPNEKVAARRADFLRENLKDARCEF